MGAMKRMCNDHKERYTIHKNSLIRKDDQVKGNRCIVNAGMDLYEDGSKVYIHSHNHKDLHNKYKAICR